MNAIWRFPLTLTGQVTVDMPAGAQALAVGPYRQPAGADILFESQPIDLWAVVDPEQPLEQRTFHIVGTGNPTPPDLGRYVDTTHSHGGTLIWHVFEAQDGAA